MKERLAQFLRSEGLTAVKFAEIIEVQPSSISHLLSGRNKPNFEFISRLLKRFPNLNPDWIINGAGDIYKSNAGKLPNVNKNTAETQVTSVITDDVADLQESAENTIQEKMSGESTDNDIARRDEMHITNVNSVISDSVEPVGGDRPIVVSKPISRVIIFYADGSFDEYHN